jgi:hypothetical protein
MVTAYRNKNGLQFGRLFFQDSAIKIAAKTVAKRKNGMKKMVETNAPDDEFLSKCSTTMKPNKNRNGSEHKVAKTKIKSGAFRCGSFSGFSDILEPSRFSTQDA